MPVDPGKVLYYGLKNANTGQYTSAKENSKAWFLLLNDGKAYTAYVMVLIGDPGYINGDPSKLAKNSYRKRDANFSGMLLYFTPKGKFIRSYKYVNGKQVTGSSQTTTTSTQQTQSVKNTNKVSTLCIDWYDTVWDSYGNVEWEQYIGTTCSDYDDGTGNGGGGGGGATPNPCQVTNSVTQKAVNVAQPPIDPGDGSGGDDDGGDDPGYPDPSQGSACGASATITNNTTTPCLSSQIDNVSNNSSFQTAFTSMLRNTFGISNTVNIEYAEADDPNSTDDAVTNGQNTSLLVTFNTSQISNASKEYLLETIMHESYHAYLDINPSLWQNMSQHAYMIQNYVNAEVATLT